VVLIPIEPSGAAVRACKLTIDQVLQAQQVKPALKGALVINRKQANTVLGRDIRQMASQYDFPILEAEIISRVSFAEALTLGKTIFELAGNGPAGQDIKGLCDETEKLNHG
jgi:chromosome partitioning protein